MTSKIPWILRSCFSSEMGEGVGGASSSLRREHDPPDASPVSPPDSVFIFLAFAIFFVGGLLLSIAYVFFSEARQRARVSPDDEGPVDWPGLDEDEVSRPGDSAPQPSLEAAQDEGGHVASGEGWGNMRDCHVSSRGDAALDREFSGGGSTPVLIPPDMGIAHHACVVCGRQGIHPKLKTQDQREEGRRCAACSDVFQKSEAEEAQQWFVNTEEEEEGIRNSNGEEVVRNSEEEEGVFRRSDSRGAHGRAGSSMRSSSSSSSSEVLSLSLSIYISRSLSLSLACPLPLPL